VEEEGQADSRHQGSGQLIHAGRVAPISVAGADLGVVLLQDGGVARPVLLVMDVATATDNPHVSAHFLIDLPAEGVLLVGGTFLQEFLCLRLLRRVRVVEGVSAVIAVVAIAYVAFYSRTCLDQAEKEDDGGGRGDQFGVHPAGWLLVEI